MLNIIRKSSFILSLLAASTALADSNCIDELIKHGNENLTVKELRASCYSDTTNKQNESALEQRIQFEQNLKQNPFALLPHRPNYFLPLAYNDVIKSELTNNVFGDAVDDVEFQFQLSVKALLFDGLFNDKGKVWFAYTNRSFWQAYNGKISSPFRETNHEPEILLSLHSELELWGFRNRANIFSFNHQSNGRTGSLSRSWNRIMLQSIWYKDNVAFHIRPWYRIPEDKDSYVGDPYGDDNPDIERFLGHFDFQGAYKYRDHTFSMMLRNNLRTSNNKGAIELGWSIPFKPKVKGYVKYFKGYGDSLLDYNTHIQSLALGLELSGWF